MILQWTSQLNAFFAIFPVLNQGRLAIYVPLPHIAMSNLLLDVGVEDSFENAFQLSDSGIAWPRDIESLTLSLAPNERLTASCNIR